MQTIGIFEAKTRFSELAQEVNRGKTIVVTKNDKPYLELRPFVQEEPDTMAAIEELRTLRGTVRLGKLSIRALLTEGRR